MKTITYTEHAVQTIVVELPNHMLKDGQPTEEGRERIYKAIDKKGFSEVDIKNTHFEVS